MSPTVHIPDQGTVQGSLDPKKNVLKFLNIPYGTVARRWRPAVKPQPWTGIRDATKQGPVPPQPREPKRFSKVNNAYSDFDFDDQTTVISERDCLNLNIYVHEDTLAQAQAETGAHQEAAVMVFIHGGGFRDGCNAMDIYDGTNLVAESAKLGKPVIVITINYRLGFLGFFSCPELVQDLQNDPNLTSDYERVAGNWGLMDQRMALQWVRANISLWGGQAHNITAFGQSLGSASVHFHMLIPQHKRLFERAIMQSSSASSCCALRPEVEGLLYRNVLLERFHIPQDLSAAEKLARLEKISDVEMGWAAEDDRVSMFSPYVDGVMIQEDIRLLTHKTAQYDHGVKAVMVGDVKEETTIFVAAMEPNYLAVYPFIKATLYPETDAGRAAWDKVFGSEVNTNDRAYNVARDVLAHNFYYFPDFSTLRALSKRSDLGQGFDLFQFYFDRPITKVEEIKKKKHAGRGWGAHHCVDLVFTFGPDLALESVFSEEEIRLCKEMQRIWVQFAYGETQGVLNTITRPVDDFEYHAQAKEAIVFAEDCTVKKAHCSRQGRDVCELWELEEQYIHEMRKTGGAAGLKVGLLGFDVPKDSSWFK